MNSLRVTCFPELLCELVHLATRLASYFTRLNQTHHHLFASCESKLVIKWSRSMRSSFQIKVVLRSLTQVFYSEYQWIKRMPHVDLWRHFIQILIQGQNGFEARNQPADRDSSTWSCHFISDARRQDQAKRGEYCQISHQVALNVINESLIGLPR